MLTFMQKDVMNLNKHKKRIQNSWDFPIVLLNDKEIILLWIVLLTERKQNENYWNS